MVPFKNVHAQNLYLSTQNHHIFNEIDCACNVEIDRQGGGDELV